MRFGSFITVPTQRKLDSSGNTVVLRLVRFENAVIVSWTTAFVATSQTLKTGQNSREHNSNLFKLEALAHTEDEAALISFNILDDGMMSKRQNRRLIPILKNSAASIIMIPTVAWRIGRCG